jgi:type IV pilus assembly protein PilA
MLERLMQRRRQGNEEGFTLIELMVVVLIIAILIAIAIPTFLGARARAQNRAAQSSLRNALTAAKTMYTDTNSYATADSTTTGLVTVEPSLTYSAAGTASTGPKLVSVNPAAASWSAAAKSDSGQCYYIKDVSTGPGTTFGGSGSAACTGTQADTSATATSFP